MARPKKEGMDYFPHDVDAVNDEKIEALRALYGNDGYAFYFIMLERIYRSNNFQILVSDAETKEETFQILSRKMMLSIEKFNQIFETSLKWNCFDKKLYREKGIITSLGIKKRSKVVVDKREKMKEYYEKKQVVSASETTEETTEETTQSKVKKSKEENSIEKKSSSSTGELFKFYDNNIQPLTEYITGKINLFLDDGVTDELMLKYFQIAVERKKANWSYIQTMAQNNLNDGIKTISQYEDLERRFKESQISKNNTNKVEQANNFKQRDYEEDEFEQYYSNK